MTPEQLREDMLSAYLDDELDAETRTAVDERLTESNEWRGILDELRETRGALRALPEVDGSPEFWSRVLAGDDVVDLAAARRKRAERAPVWRIAVASAAAAVVIVVGVAAVPEKDQVNPAVATFADAHAARSSLGNDVLSNLASVGVPGLGR